MLSNQPFTVTTTITTVVYPERVRADREDGMEHTVVMETDAEIPQHLLHGITQAACENTMEGLMETGIGVQAEIVEEDYTRCPVGNLRRFHLNGPCEPGVCDMPGLDDDVIDVECVEVGA